MHDSAVTVTFLFYISPNETTSRDTTQKTTENCILFSDIFKKVCHDYHVSLCHNLHEPFGLPQGVLTLDYVAHASMTRFSLSIDVYCSTCLSVLWIKTNVTVYTFKLCEVCVPLMPLSTHKYLFCQVKIDFTLYIAVPLRTNNNGFKLERQTVRSKGYRLNNGIHYVEKRENIRKDEMTISIVM